VAGARFNAAGPSGLGRRGAAKPSARVWRNRATFEVPAQGIEITPTEPSEIEDGVIKVATGPTDWCSSVRSLHGASQGFGLLQQIRKQKAVVDDGLSQIFCVDLPRVCRV
jgi:hypothetical protein